MTFSIPSTHPTDILDNMLSPSDILKHVCSRWGARILITLNQHSSLRFSELRSELKNVSEKMLAQTLQTLAHDGFILRDAYATMPPIVEYRLTLLGEELAGHVGQLVQWIDLNLEQIQQARNQEVATPDIPQ
ncbi:hypothetical protein BFW38_09375 [Terasakiispira papahanaumokuakeensis]|uniref:HTH hxlR-type domain-containing protein n=1 Tax=Terasakiispira papahanaumokuakeensis TaxID=197479 RepID=A0A1E2V9N4_9GAMM|nr:helix-turn-helix domain-containing protein [Terasakiispira papahanaumokuakeensis]ODC03720.1 hypothetical protein BFW38_09375 [Terasakiispira papahanaumokuakeensis]